MLTLYRKLLMAKLVEAGHSQNGRALKGIARLLVADAENLHSLIDEDIFDAILCCLDYRLPAGVRTQATMVVAKYLEASPDKGQQYLVKQIQFRLSKQKDDDLIIAFSAATAIFPVIPTIASSFFLIEGFVPSLQPLLQRKVKSDK